MLLLPGPLWPESWVPAARTKQAEASVSDSTGPLWIYDGTLFPADGEAPSVGLVPAESLVTYNGSYAWGRYDGQLWQGRGWNLAERGGVWFDSPVVFGQAAPELGYSQNLAFATGPDRNSGDVDFVQRFGRSPLTFLGWGQSFIGARWGQLDLRLSTENLWIGPVYKYPIVWGTEAAGFPHARLTLQKTQTAWGTWEAMTMLGSLEASSQSAKNAYGGHRAFWGLVAGYSPPFLPELTLGASRTLISRWDQLSPVDLGRLFLPKIPSDTDQTDQRMNLTWRFRFPSQGFEAYGEWARNDFSPSLTRVLVNPFHSEAWTSGLVQKLDLGSGNALGVGVEFTNLTLPLEQINNANGYGGALDFYTHGILREGYTNGGQLLGSPIGNGGNAQSLTLTWYHPEGEVHLTLERWHRDGTYFYSQQFRYDHPDFNAVELETDVDVELSWTIGWSWRNQDLTWYGQLTWMKDWNRYYVLNNTIEQYHLELGVRFSPQGALFP